MTSMTKAFEGRQQKSRQLCERLMDRIGEVAAAVPLDHWPPVVDAPSAAFMVALTAWEIDPNDLTMQQVTDTYGAVVEAWRMAAAEFTTEQSA